jgi:DNA-binding transcriptional MerR regulator
MSARWAVGKPATSLPLISILQILARKNLSSTVLHMSRSAVAIPEKLFFKIGEVCELAGVQAHVLRYWESEFTMLAPQKNRAGQRVYRKRDVEIALRIKELLYEDQYTIAGAKKRLANDLRAGGKLRIVSSEGGDEETGDDSSQSATQDLTSTTHSNAVTRTAEERKALQRFNKELREILAMIDAPIKNSKPR